MLCCASSSRANRAEHGRFYHWTRKRLRSVCRRGYERSLKWCMHHKPFIMGLFALSLLATVVMFMTSSRQDFIPSEDTGQIHVNRPKPPTASPSIPMVKYAAAAGRHRQARSQCPGGGVLGGFGRRRAPAPTPAPCCSSSSTLSQRSLSADEIIQELRPKLQRVPGHQRLYAEPARHPGGRPVHQIHSINTAAITDQDQLQKTAAKLTERPVPCAGLRRCHQRHGLHQPVGRM